MLYLIDGINVYSPECDSASCREAMERMADAWRRRVAEEERIANLVLAVDQLVSAPVISPRAGEREKKFRGLVYRLVQSFLFRLLQPKLDLDALKFVQRRGEWLT